MTPRNTLYALLLALPLLAITGCEKKVTPLSQSSQSDDSSVRLAVSAALQRDTQFAQRDIIVTSQQGQVLLSGTVASMQDKNRAGDIAKQVAGVKGVSNKLEIVTPVSAN